MTYTSLIGANFSNEQQFLLGEMANRHGLIAGATGTGKTVTLQVLAEGFSRMGVPVFAADIKGDLSGIAEPGKMNKVVEHRVEHNGITDFKLRPYPTRFWDIFGESGHVVRTTVSEMGPELLSNLMDLTETQAGILHVVFSYAEDNNLKLLDINDLQTTINYMNEHRKEVEKEYGRMSTQSVGAIQRKLLVLEEQGGGEFFGEPALDIKDFMQVEDGFGVINLLEGRSLMLKPRVYTTFLLWFLSELFEQLDEQGDSDKPRLVFFFDEAHLLFDNAPKVLLERFEQVIRLIRSKGVGIYFVTQSPSDIPDSVLGQLGNRVQHALRAFTPKEQKAIRTVAQTFRANPDLDTEQVITELGLGEALVSVLDEKGIPTHVQKTLISPPESQIGPIEAAMKQRLIARSPMAEKYEKDIDRESAHEVLNQKLEQQAQRDEKRQEEEKKASLRKSKTKRKSTRMSTFESLFRSFARSLVTGFGRRLVTMIIRSLFRR